LSLEQHVADTEQAATMLFRPGTRWSHSYLRFFKLNPDLIGSFILNLRIAALLHDVGKANVDLQNILVSTASSSQSLRHEHLSALLLADPRVDGWLAGNALLDRDVILAAVLSHHLKASEDGDWRVLQPRSAGPTRLLFNHVDVRRILHAVASAATLDLNDLTFPNEYDHPDWAGAWDALWLRSARFRKDMRADPDRHRLCLAVKAGLIVADSVASGLFRVGCQMSDWIEEVAHAAHLAEDQVDRDILQPRIQELSSKKPFVYQRFQEGAASIGRRALLLAGCGSGKTLAAWRWADAVVRHEQIGRVVFLYPTRGTATEGFRDYVGHAPEGRAALVHGAARYELQGMLANPSDLPPSLAGKNIVPDQAEQRLFALGLWSKRYFSATVDQFLAFMEHSYGSLCLLPALADSAVVFDEIHSYDRIMWNALITFLDRFDLPVLCMTATLPPDRRAELERRLRGYPDASDRHLLADLEAAETRPRYRLQEVTKEAAVVEAAAAARAGCRVLWVVNTVARCQRLAVRLRDEFGLSPLVYHSRFKLDDRQRRHRDAVDAFRLSSSDSSPAIAITTQVCEMSLDLDADVLVTEHAPVSSLVQRFGRANRHPRESPEFRAELRTYAPDDIRPYDRAEIEAGRALLESLAGREISQRDLANGIELHAPAGRDASGASRFIDGGFFATPGSLRDEDGSGQIAVLDSDIARYVAFAEEREPTDGLRLNVPRKWARPSNDPRLPPWLAVASGERYDEWLGFLVDEDAR
jgi:CRISPR-associated endonuclease/helicase Cas3